MYKQLSILSAVTILAHQAQARVGWGPHLATAKLSPVAVEVALWPGMETTGGHLIQALAISGVSTSINPVYDDECGSGPGQWCIMTSTFKDSKNCADAFSPEGPGAGPDGDFGGCAMTRGAKVPANEGDHVLMHYKYNDDTSKYDQAVYLNGDLVSTLSTDSGHAYNWMTEVECQMEGCSSTLQKHEYLDTVIRMDSPVSLTSLDKKGVTTSGFETSDEGLTWSCKKIDVSASTVFDMTKNKVATLGLGRVVSKRE